MRTNRVVNTRTRDLNLNGVFDLYSSRSVKIQRSGYRVRGTRNVSCQCDTRKELACTCRNVGPAEARYFSRHKQVYRYSDLRSFTENDVVVALPRKGIRKSYLPDTNDKGVGSADLTSYITRRSRKRWADNYYYSKRNSSKYVGAFTDNEKVSLINKKLSPVVQKRSASTSPKDQLEREKNRNITSSHQHTITTQIDIHDLINLQYKEFNVNRKEKNKQTDFVVTRTSEAMPDSKSVSLLRRRFEALRRGFSKKDSKKRSVAINKVPSHVSIPRRKDICIASYQSFLEGRSYSNVKVCSPFPSTTHDCKTQEKVSYRKTPENEKVKNDSKWSTQLIHSKLCKSRGKKFNLNEEYCKVPPKTSKNATKNQIDELNLKSESPIKEVVSEKKHRRKFFFFRKKIKEKENKPFNSKIDVTAGRCELKKGLRIKVGGGNDCDIAQSVIKSEKYLDEYESILHKTWLEKFIANSDDSRNSVNIRWNNKKYAASSSTVLKLLDSLSKQTGIDLKSRSNIRTGKLLNHHSYTKRGVNFLHQDIETWMIQEMIIDKEKQTFPEMCYNRGKFTKNLPIEFVLQDNPNNTSSNYVVINIPEFYFSQSSSNDIHTHSSDEKIYKIVEYDNCDSKKIEENHIATGDSITNNLKVNNNEPTESKESKISDTIAKTPPLLRDVAIQGSNVVLPKRCDVISVGIITQRDIRDVRKPILQIDDELSNDESKGNLLMQKKCKLAENYLQEYYHNLMPLGIDLYSWHLSESQLRSSYNSADSLTQDDGIKSCSKMYDDIQEPTMVNMMSSCEASSCSHCIALKGERRPDDSLKRKFFNIFKRKSSSEAHVSSEKRHFPKDSLEVYKKRQFYAGTNQKSKWCNSAECQKLTKPCWRLIDTIKMKKVHSKRVSFSGCKLMSGLADQLSNSSLEGIMTYKGSGCNQKLSQSKRAEVSPKPVCEIPHPPCKDFCLKDKKPECMKKNAPPCDDVFPKFLNSDSVPPSKRFPASLRPSSNSPVICIKPKNIVCHTPCNKVSQTTHTNDENFQISKKPSQSGLSLKTNLRESPKPSPKNSGKCSKTCRNKSNESLYKQKRHKDINKERISGLHLKKLGSKINTFYNDSSNYRNNEDKEVLHLNSREKITICMKKDSLTGNESREGLSIKVQDKDGQTIYQKTDYKQSRDPNKCALLKNIYNNTLIQRASTSIIAENIELQESKDNIHECKSDTGTDNLIEINFTLKFKQGDKGTKIDIKNDEDTKVRHVTQSQKDVYVVQDQAVCLPASGNKKDVNINIVIKNYKTEPDRSNELETYTNSRRSNNFNNRISEKFHTVSTGHSDTIDQYAFSVHRATVDLKAEQYGDQSKDSCGVSNHESIKNSLKKLIPSSQSIATRSNTDQTINSMKLSHAETDYFHSSGNYRAEKNNINRIGQGERDNDTEIKIKLRNKGERKGMLKGLFRSPSVIKKREKTKKIGNIIGVILNSDSSGNEDMTLISNELVQELTYGSLDPSYFRDTDSMNNYYQLDSELSDYKQSVHKKLNPTKNNSDCCLYDSVVSFANGEMDLVKDNRSKGNRYIQKDKEVTEDTASNDYILNFKSCVDVETQNSVHTNSSKIKNLSVRNKTQSVVANVSAFSEKNIDKTYAEDKNKPSLSDINCYGMKRFNRKTILDLSNDELLVVNSNLVAESIRKCYRKKLSKRTDNNNVADILQLNETKKAVLEIYAEETVSDDGERLAVRLPKFDLDKDIAINNYKETITGRKRIGKRNFVMTS